MPLSLCVFYVSETQLIPLISNQKKAYIFHQLDIEWSISQGNLKA